MCGKYVVFFQVIYARIKFSRPELCHLFTQQADVVSFDDVLHPAPLGCGVALLAAILLSALCRRLCTCRHLARGFADSFGVYVLRVVCRACVLLPSLRGVPGGILRGGVVRHPLPVCDVHPILRLVCLRADAHAA